MDLKGLENQLTLEVSEYAGIWWPNTNTPNIEDCVVMKNNGSLAWDDIECTAKSTPVDGETSSDKDMKIQALCQCKSEECSATTTTTTAAPDPVVCPANWVKNDQLGCISRLPEEVKTFEDADKECNKLAGGTNAEYIAGTEEVRKGWMVEPSDECKETALKDYLKYSLSVTRYWIGLKWGTDLKPPAWTWKNGTIYDYKDWTPGQGDDLAEFLQCAAIKKTGNEWQWSNILCENMSGVGGICVTDPGYKCQNNGGGGGTSTTATTSTTSSGTTTKPSDCQYNPNEANSPCYLLNTNGKSFQEAEDYCVTLGGHLASSLSQSENSFLGQLFASSSGSYWWIGGQCGNGVACNSGDSWSWTDGSTWSYNNFATDDGQPGNTHGACVLYHRGPTDWMSWTCTTSAPFVCKI